MGAGGGLELGLCVTPSFSANLCASGCGRDLGGPPGVSQAGMGGGVAESGELLPVSLGRGPGECSMCRALVGASFPPPLCSMTANWKDVERGREASHGS